jgi:hypothetical protein
MPIYDCNLCNYKTKIRSQLNRHLNTQKHKNNIALQPHIWCETNPIYKKELKKNSTADIVLKKELKKNSNADIVFKKNSNAECIIKPNDTQLIEMAVCEYCSVQFKTRHIMLKHIRQHCKAKKEYDMIYIKKDKEIEELKSQVKELISKVGNTTNNTTINNQTYNQQTNVQQNVNLNVFGKEDLSMLTDEFKRELIKGPFVMMPKLMEMVYFNKEYPQNHTMKLVNKNKDILKIHDKNGWKYVAKDATVDYILEDKNCEVDDYYDLNGEEFSHFVKNTYKDFRRMFDSQDKELWKKIKHDVDLLLWNNMKSTNNTLV